MLRLQLLGGFRARTDGADASSLATQPRRAALLAHLAVERDVPRERVIDLLWPDSPPERGRHSLNQGIYFLRRLIGADWVELRGDRCVVAPWVSTDVQELEAAAALGDHDAVLRLYEGPLLAGTPLAATAEFDMWADGRRIAIDRLHRRARRHRIAELVAAGDTRAALECAAEWCHLDPLEDEAQHRHIELLAAAGQRTAALRRFQAYSRLLEEHELEPLEQTLALVRQLQHGGVAVLPAAPMLPLPATAAALLADSAAAERAAANSNAAAYSAAAGHPGPTRPHPGAAGGRAAWLLGTRAGLLALLAGVFLVNLVETTVETWLEPRLPVIGELRLQTARAAHWLEGHYTFEYHELTNPVAVIGYSTAYFIVFPLLLLGVGLALARRPGIRPFRVFSLGVAINYAVSLPFFLFFPVAERWTYPESGAIVLSDLWTVQLIDVFRPISGLDNSFPSFHTSLTVLVVLTAFLFRLRHRWTTLFLGATVVLATFVLGIHWTMDIVAGAAVAVLSVALALEADRRLAARAAPGGPHEARAGRAGRHAAAAAPTAPRHVAEHQLEPR
jgi:DNA-binding SARP family transcriptional activator/membrane-associated phospholipid phosphatase